MGRPARVHRRGSDVPSGRRHFLLGAATGVAGLAGGLRATTSAAESSSGDEPTAVDIGFCTDMSAHHGQALVMCQRVLGRDTGDPVQAAAAEVLQNQAIEVGQMRAWLADWGQSTAEPETVMGWMASGRAMPLDAMPGLAGDAELQALSQAGGLEKGRLWLELMRAHHVGGVAMAEQAVELASAAKVVRLATNQVGVQTYEISQYDHLLAGEYA